MKHARWFAAVPLAAAFALSSIAVPALAADPASDYGRHVVHCTQDMGFSGTHNPGVHHRGHAGWPGAHDC